jgi:hypothetical protein
MQPLAASNRRRRAPECSSHSSRIALTVTIALAVLLSPLLAWADDPAIDRQIYTSYVNSGYCIRLTHQNDVVGCSTPYDGVSGRIRLAQDQASLDALFADPPGNSLAILLAQSLMTNANLVAMREKLDVAGVMVLPTSTTAVPTAPASGYSPATQTPQYLPFIPPSADIPDAPTTKTLFNNSYVWNPLGQDIINQRFDFAIVTVTPDEKEYLIGLAQKNEENAQEGNFVYNMAKFYFYMYGKTSTPQCLKDTTCTPVGGYSVWGTLGNLTTNGTTSTRPFLMLTTKVDAAGLFHQLTPGGDESQASVAVLVAAINALVSVPGVGNLPRQILFALFQGESWSHVGSRKFVDDLQNFQCVEFNVDNDAGTNAACNNPYKNTLDFQQVNFKLIDKIIEVGQIGLNATVFVHRQKDGNTVTTDMIRTVYRVAANLSTPLSVSPALSDTPGIPPACAEAFLDANEKIATVVLTDHAGAYANQYHQSEFDGPLNMLIETDTAGGNAVITHPNLCAKSTLLARMAWIEAGGDEQTSRSIQVNCTLIDDLLHCLLEDINCQLIQSVSPSAFSSPTSNFNTYPHYTSVYNLFPESYIDGMSQFLYQLMAPWVLNATAWVPPPPAYDGDSWPPQPVNIHYHDAVDPNLVFDIAESAWKIKPTANDRYLYTESQWDSSIGYQTFRAEDPMIEVTSLVIGIAVAVASVLSIGAMQKYCLRRYKRLQA